MYYCSAAELEHTIPLHPRRVEWWVPGFVSKDRQPEKKWLLSESLALSVSSTNFSTDLSYIVPCTAAISAQQLTKEEIQKIVREAEFIIKFTTLTTMLYPGLFIFYLCQPKILVQRWKGRGMFSSKEPTFSKRIVSFHPLSLSKEFLFQ